MGIKLKEEFLNELREKDNIPVFIAENCWIKYKQSTDTYILTYFRDGYYPYYCTSLDSVNEELDKLGGMIHHVKEEFK